MKKRFLSMLLAIVMVVGLVPATALAADTIASGTCGTNVNWTLDNNGLLTITGSGPMTSSPWTSNYKSSIKEVIIKDGVTSIYAGAFDGCTYLEKITVNGDLTEVGGFAFQNCPNLTSATFEGDIGAVGGRAFNSAGSTLNLTIRGNATSFGQNVFDVNYTTVTIHYEGMTNPSAPASGQFYEGNRFHNYFKIYVTPQYYANTTTFCNRGVVAPKMNITVNVTPENSGTAEAQYNGSKVTSFEMRGELTLVVNPAEDYVLKSYSGNVTFDENKKFTVGAQDVEINVEFEAIPDGSYTVSFNANGGTGNMDMIAIQSDETKTLPKNLFEKKNYAFKGWNTASDGSGTSYADGAEISVTENITLYAQWEAITYSVTYEANGGTGTMASATVTASGSNNYTFPECEFTPPDGKVFSGWTYGTSTKTYLPGSSIKITQNITVTAQWAEAVAEVTIGGTPTSYGTLEQAAAAVAGKIATIKLLKEVTLTKALTFNAMDLTLELNGKSISNNKLTLNNTVSIIGPGTLERNGTCLDIAMNAIVTVNEGVEIISNSTANASVINMMPLSTLILKGGSITLGNTNSVQIGGTSRNKVVVYADGVAKRFTNLDVYYNITPADEPTVKTGGTIWYKIDNQIEGASVTAAGSSTYDGNTYATKGATVTVSKAGLADCYCNNVAATKNQNGTFAFTMPAAVATITEEKTHVHEWEYFGNDATITASCTDTDDACDDTNGGSVTISAIDGIYDGMNEFKATLIGEFSTGLDLDVTDITYEYSSTEDGEYTTADDCVKAGYYKASISVENNVTATVSYRVTKAVKDAPEAPQLESKTTRSITVKEVEGCEYSIDGENWQASTEFTYLTPATEYTIYIRYAGDENHEPSLEKFEVFTTDNLVLDRIEIATQPKLDYTASDTLDLSGMVVTAYYTDGSSALLAYTDVTTSIANGTMLTVSENGAVITVTYNGKTARTAAITVQQKQSGFDYDMWYWTLMMLYNQQFDITATATDGGVITPAGVSKVKYSNDLTYTIMPDDGYVIADVIVDGESIGAVSVYKFDNVRKDHEIIAIFAEIPWQNPYSDVSAKDWFYEDVQFVDENGLMNGTVENEIFAPELTATRAMIVTILWRLEGKPVVDSPVDFFDVPENEWYTDAINWASANGIVLGYEDGMFYPDKSITREQLAAILHRYAAYKGVDNGVIFPMIPHYDYSEWAENDVIWADMNGMLDGIGSDMTDMTADASRAEVAAMLRRFCERFSAE